MDTIKLVWALLSAPSADDWAAGGLFATFFFVMVFVL